MAQAALNHSGNLATAYNEKIASLAQIPDPMFISSVVEYGHEKEGAKAYGDNHDESKVESSDQDWQPLTRSGKALLLGPLHVIKKKLKDGMCTEMQVPTDLNQCREWYYDGIAYIQTMASKELEKLSLSVRE